MGRLIDGGGVGDVDGVDGVECAVRNEKVPNFAVVQLFVLKVPCSQSFSSPLV